MTSQSTEELNALRTRLSNFGHGNWAGKSTTTLDDQLRIAQSCVDALDQFDRYETDIARLRAEVADLTRQRDDVQRRYAASRGVYIDER